MKNKAERDDIVYDEEYPPDGEEAQEILKRRARVARGKLGAAPGRPKKQVCEKDRDALRLAKQRKSQRFIAARLGVSQATVRRMIARAFQEEQQKRLRFGG